MITSGLLLILSSRCATWALPPWVRGFGCVGGVRRRRRVRTRPPGRRVCVAARLRPAECVAAGASRFVALSCVASAMPPPPEALKLRAAFGDAAFAKLKAAKNRYRDGEGLDAQGFLTMFYALAAEDDGVAARADSLLSLVTALLPPPKRGALRDPSLRGRARNAAAASAQLAHAAPSAQHVRVTLKSLQHPPREVQLRRDCPVEQLRAQVSRGARCTAQHAPSLLQLTWL